MIDKNKLYAHHFKGELHILKNPRHKLDQINIDTIDKHKIIHATYFARYLKKTYDISLSEYFNIVVHDEIDKSHFCVICNEKLSFVSLNRGFNRVCYREACRRKLQRKNPEFVEIMKNANSKFLTNLHKNKDFAKEHNIRCTQMMTDLHKDSSHLPNATKRGWLAYCRNRQIDNAYFCIIQLTDSSKFKIGITINFQNRWSLNISKKNIIVIDLHESSIENVAELEYQLKIKFIHQNEWIDSKYLDDVQLHMNNYYQKILTHETYKENSRKIHLST